MRAATQIRCDEYESSGNRVRVTSRKDHLINTDLKISRKFDGKILRFPERDPVFDAHVPEATGMDYAHIDKTISLDIDDMVINKSIDRMRPEHPRNVRTRTGNSPSLPLR